MEIDKGVISVVIYHRFIMGGGVGASDLDGKNIGTEKFGVIGSTIVNGTIEPMLKMVEGKEAIFYGATISGTASCWA